MLPGGDRVGGVDDRLRLLVATTPSAALAVAAARLDVGQRLHVPGLQGQRR